jgi:hypothetical protein
MLSATDSANTKPEQTACTSNATPPCMPIASCTRTAVAGIVRSGVQVASTIRSTSAPLMPACFSAAVAAPIARSDVCSPSAAIRRSLMPVRCVIHSSVVSTMRAMS